MTSFNMRSARLRPGEVFRETVPIELEALELSGERYRPVPDEAQAALELTRLTSGTLFALAFDVAVDGPCFRCLEEASVPVRIRAREYQAADGEGGEQTANPYLADDRLDLSAWARDAIALALPDKILCDDACAGLCPGCGANLNQAACTCGPPEPDPRFAKLAELRDRL